MKKKTTRGLANWTMRSWVPWYFDMTSTASLTAIQTRTKNVHKWAHSTEQITTSTQQLNLQCSPVNRCFAAISRPCSTLEERMCYWMRIQHSTNHCAPSRNQINQTAWQWAMQQNTCIRHTAKSCSEQHRKQYARLNWIVNLSALRRRTLNILLSCFASYPFPRSTIMKATKIATLKAPIKKTLSSAGQTETSRDCQNSMLAQRVANQSLNDSRMQAVH